MLAPSSPKKFLLFSLVAACVLITLGILFYQSIGVRKAAPVLSYMNLKGEQITSQSLMGKVTIINFWTTDCRTCVAEMPHMIDTYQKFHAKGLEFIAVALKRDPPNFVLNFAQARQLPFHVALDLQGNIAESFGNVQLTPTTFVIDKKGNIVKTYVGQPSFSELHSLIERELAI